VILWLNGPFGGGKTTTSIQLQRILSGSRVFDPEMVGYMLTAALPDLTVDDFQTWPSWRPLVAAALDEVSRQTGQHLVAPQSLLNVEYFREIFAALHSRGLQTFHVVLDAPDDVLRSRIEASDEAQPWRLRQLPAYIESRSWMFDEADLVVDTGTNSPLAVAQLVIDALPGGARS